MNVNILIVGGRLTRDPELKTGANGRPVCRSSMAINRKRKGGEDEVVFLDITCFDQLAESFHRFHRKGSTVLCTGRLYQHNWKDQDGKDRVRLTMVADSWEFGGGEHYKRPQSTQPKDDQTIDF